MAILLAYKSNITFAVIFGQVYVKIFSIDIILFFLIPVKESLPFGDKPFTSGKANIVEPTKPNPLNTWSIETQEETVLVPNAIGNEHSCQPSVVSK